MPLPPHRKGTHWTESWRGYIHGLYHIQGLSKREVARKAGMDYKTVRRILEGPTEMTRRNQPVPFLDKETCIRLRDEGLNNPDRRNQSFEEIARDLEIRAPRAVIYRSLRAEGVDLNRYLRLKTAKPTRRRQTTA
ncbi:hypothetical protein KC343_g3267 [Hortaea werneckii]|nr:hypothetical protein KC352_g18278 [Hortaea werneckii]KAI7569040.1 hypothetical protein KC317_g3663 [Hortaea werneckii]KAI7622515.1 hypothetical protein KC346_g3163 [Hortaea werneckii]KAI7632825.1 hypothetical protein KC343_g3267 [Hortaea werneckii]KAI7645994.1 hypothetical protein KC319_g11904 [Hortaea werneckii]